MKLFLASLVFVVACNDSSGQELDPDVVFADACPAVTCGAATPIASADALAARIEASTEWPSIGPSTSGCLAASEDLAITGAFELDGADVALPTKCSNGVCADYAIEFRLRGTPAGVECLEPGLGSNDGATCARIRVTDTTLRVRTVVADRHPAQGYLPVVEVLAACDATCGAEEIADTSTHTCWDTARDQCAHALDGTNERCACWDGADFLADGAECTLWLSTDVLANGACQAGACVIAGR